MTLYLDPLGTVELSRFQKGVATRGSHGTRRNYPLCSLSSGGASCSGSCFRSIAARIAQRGVCRLAKHPPCLVDRVEPSKVPMQHAGYRLQFYSCWEGPLEWTPNPMTLVSYMYIYIYVITSHAMVCSGYRTLYIPRQPAVGSLTKALSQSPWINVGAMPCGLMPGSTCFLGTRNRLIPFPFLWLPDLIL